MRNKKHLIFSMAAPATKRFIVDDDRVVAAVMMVVFGVRFVVGTSKITVSAQV